MLPGVPYLFVIALLYGLIDHFTRLSLNQLAVLGGIAVLSVVVDQLAGIIGARIGGAHGKTFFYGIAGAIVGTLIMPLFGGFVGLFIGIFVGEMHRRRTKEQALKAATVGLIGSLTGIVINIILAIVFVTLFLVFVI